MGKYLPIIFILLITVLTEFFIIRLLEEENAGLKNKLSVLQQQFEIREQRVKDAQTEANQEVEKIQNTVDGVMTTSINGGCKSAIDWGISQAGDFT